jgi:symplekin
LPARTPVPVDDETPPRTETPATVKAEPIDPLQMDIDEEELDYEPEKINLQVSSV